MITLRCSKVKSSPVAGFLPRRASFFLTMNFPNLGSLLQFLSTLTSSSKKTRLPKKFFRSSLAGAFPEHGFQLLQMRPNYEWDQIDCAHAAREKNTILTDSDRLEARTDKDLRDVGSQYS